MIIVKETCLNFNTFAHPVFHQCFLRILFVFRSCYTVYRLWKWEWRWINHSLSFDFSFHDTDAPKYW